MMSFIYFHQRCTTSCAGKLSNTFGSSVFKTPNKLFVVSSKKIEYSENGKAPHSLDALISQVEKITGIEQFMSGQMNA